MQVEAQEAMREALKAIQNLAQGARDPWDTLTEIDGTCRRALSLNPQGDPAQSPNEGIERAASEPVAWQYRWSRDDPWKATSQNPEVLIADGAAVRPLYTRPQPSVDKPAEPSAQTPEGETPADARVLRKANHELAEDLFDAQEVVADLTRQIHAFAAEQGEADFETGRAHTLLEKQRPLDYHAMLKGTP